MQGNPFINAGKAVHHEEREDIDFPTYDKKELDE